MDWARTTVWQDEKHLTLWFDAPYSRGLAVIILYVSTSKIYHMTWDALFIQVISDTYSEPLILQLCKFKIYHGTIRCCLWIIFQWCILSGFRRNHDYMQLYLPNCSAMNMAQATMYTRRIINRDLYRQRWLVYNIKIRFYNKNIYHEAANVWQDYHFFCWIGNSWW